jgi:hypothetical protein
VCELAKTAVNCSESYSTTGFAEEIKKKWNLAITNLMLAMLLHDCNGWFYGKQLD